MPSPGNDALHNPPGACPTKAPVGLEGMLRQLGKCDPIDRMLSETTSEGVWHALQWPGRGADPGRGANSGAEHPAACSGGGPDRQ